MLDIEQHRKSLYKRAKDLGVSAKELATEAGCNPRTLEKFWTRHWTPSWPTLVHVERALAKLARKNG